MQVRFDVTPNRLSQIRAAGLVHDGDYVEVLYDSRFGGNQTVAGEVDIRENVLSRDDWVVDDRNADGRRVFSTADGRYVGDVIGVTLEMPRDRAIDAVTLHSDGHDVDPADDVIVVQSWEGNPEAGFDGTDVDEFHGRDDRLYVVGGDA